MEGRGVFPSAGSTGAELKAPRAPRQGSGQGWGAGPRVPAAVHPSPSDHPGGASGWRIKGPVQASPPLSKEQETILEAPPSFVSFGLVFSGLRLQWLRPKFRRASRLGAKEPGGAQLSNLDARQVSPCPH